MLEISNITPTPDTSSTYASKLGKFNKDNNILKIESVLSSFQIADGNFHEIDSALSGIDNKIKFLIANQDVTKHVIASKDKTWYYDGNGISSYDSLNVALDYVRNQPSIHVSFVDDMSASNIMALDQSIDIDLNQHSISCDAATFALVAYDGKIIVRNGKLYVPKINADASETKFAIYRGEVRLEDIEVDADASANVSQWNYRVFNISQSSNEILDIDNAGASVLKIGSNAKIDLHNAHKGEALIVCFSPKYTACKSPKIPSLSAENDFNQAFPDPSILSPRIIVDGFVKMSVVEGVTAKEDMPGFIAGNGQDTLKTIIDINHGAEIRADGHALYFGNAVQVNVNGGTILGDTGICMRSGFLNIPRNANPTIIGIGQYKEYDPLHTLKESGDWGRNLYLGHAVLLENNGSTAYGAMPVSADIKSGTFISYNNTAIGSYGIGTESSADPTIVMKNNNDKYQVKFTYTNSKGVVRANKAIYFFTRPTFFTDGIQTMKRESQEEYVYATGKNPDYHTALSSDAPTLNAVKFESGKKVDLTTIDSLYRAVKDIYMLLGVDKDNISSVVQDLAAGPSLLDAGAPVSIDPIESPTTEFGREIIDPEPIDIIPAQA